MESLLCKVYFYFLYFRINGGKHCFRQQLQTLAPSSFAQVEYVQGVIYHHDCLFMCHKNKGSFAALKNLEV